MRTPRLVCVCVCALGVYYAFIEKFKHFLFPIYVFCVSVHACACG